VDDDAELRRLLCDFLGQYGYRLSQAQDGASMRECLGRRQVDLVVLDIMLPGDDGISLCREMRQSGGVPVIMLTARGDPVDRIVGLEVGADDYMPKPFDPRELLARIRSVLRRSRSAARSADAAGALRKLRFAGWTLDLQDRTLRAPDRQQIGLSGAEFRLMELLATHAQRVLSRDDIMELMEGRQAGPMDRRIDVQICRLRSLLGDDGRQPKLIRTIRNRGYVLTAAVEA
jgi:two-component system OmpR family response regulator